MRINTLHGSLSCSHRLSEGLGLKLVGTYSSERYNAYQIDFVLPEVSGFQHQNSERAEMKFNLHWRPSERFDAIAGYRLLHISGVENRASIPPFINALVQLDPVTPRICLLRGTGTSTRS